MVETSQGGRAQVDFGYRLHIVRTPLFSGRIPLRLVFVSAILFVLAIGFTLLAIGIGTHR